MLLSKASPTPQPNKRLGLPIKPNDPAMTRCLSITRMWLLHERGPQRHRPGHACGQPLLQGLQFLHPQGAAGQRGLKNNPEAQTEFRQKNITTSAVLLFVTANDIVSALNSYKSEALDSVQSVSPACPRSCIWPTISTPSTICSTTTVFCGSRQHQNSAGLRQADPARLSGSAQ